jgi:hypothetical protein
MSDRAIRNAVILYAVLEAIGIGAMVWATVR